MFNWLFGTKEKDKDFASICRDLEIELSTCKENEAVLTTRANAFKADNLTLLQRIGVLQSNISQQNNDISQLQDELTEMTQVKDLAFQQYNDLEVRFFKLSVELEKSQKKLAKKAKKAPKKKRK